MYNNPSICITPFQSFALLTMAQNHRKTHHHNVSILERSIQSMRFCFIEMHKDSNRIDKTNAEILLKWFNILESTLNCSVDLTIYIQTRPDS